MELEVVTGSYDGLVQGFAVDALDPESKVECNKHTAYLGLVSYCVCVCTCGRGQLLVFGSPADHIK